MPSCSPRRAPPHDATPGVHHRPNLSRHTDLPITRKVSHWRWFLLPVALLSPSAFVTVVQGQPALPVVGTWVGTYECVQGETGLSLAIANTENNVLRATFAFYSLSSNPSEPTGSFDMTGQYQGGKVSLKPTHWVQRPAGYNMVGLAGQVRGNTFSGSITTGACGAFSLTRAVAPATTWTIMPSAFPSNDEFNSLDCPQRSYCLAVGDTFGRPTRLLVESLAAGHWRSLASPAEYGGSLEAISCANAASCVAVGFRSGKKATLYNVVEQFDGKHWTTVPVATPSQASQLSGVSCTSSGFCVAIQSGVSFVRASQHARWTQVNTAKVHGTLNSISCAAKNWCVAVGSRLGNLANRNGFYVPLIESFNGTAWSVVSSPRVPNHTLSAVSCPSPRFCVAVGGSLGGTWGSITEIFRANRWFTAPDLKLNGLPAPNVLKDVTCISAASCTAVGADLITRTATDLLTAHLSDNAWAVVAGPPVGQSYYTTVACASELLCIAIGDNEGEVKGGIPQAFAAEGPA